MNFNSKIYIAGHKGLVGSAVLELLYKKGFTNCIFKTSRELDLRNQSAVLHYFEREKPEYVIMAAAKVGGIMANHTYRAEFIYDNIMIQSNIIHSSYLYNVKKLLFLGSSCIYPKLAPQPLKEEYLLSGYLEETNEPYAVAKIAGLKMCEAYRAQYGCNYITAMPTNLYGVNDNFDLETSHVLPALIRKFHEAKTNNLPLVEVWGTGKPYREFLHVNDLADACIFLMENYNSPEIINIGTGEDIRIIDLANLIKKIVDFKGEIIFDTAKQDGTPRKLLDISKMHNLGWKYKTSLETGIRNVYETVKDRL